MEQTKRPASVMILLCVSLIALFATIAGYSLSDVHNTYDFLAPFVGVIQFMFILGLFKGKLWGLIGYTTICHAVLAGVFIYSIDKGQIKQWVVPISFLIILSALAFDYWTHKRSFFK